MAELTVQSILALMMVTLGDLLVLSAVFIPAVVLISTVASSIGRVSFAQVIGYWLMSLLLALLAGIGLVTKTNSPEFAAEPNGLLLGLSDSSVLTLLGIAVLLLVLSAGLLTYILSK